MREPQPKRITSRQDAELNAFEWVRAFSFVDANLTMAGADEGVDIRTSSLIAIRMLHQVGCL